MTGAHTVYSLVPHLSSFLDYVGGELVTGNSVHGVVFVWKPSCMPTA